MLVLLFNYYNCADLECSGDLIRESFGMAQRFVWVAQLVRVPAHRAGDLGSNPGPGENFSLKLLI